MRRLGWALLLNAAVLGAANAGCGDSLPSDGRQRLERGGVQLVYAPQGGSLPLGRHFALDIALCPAPGQPAPVLLAVDAEMPAHRHGMNYRPMVQSLGQGRYRAEGLLLHMPGAWRLWFHLDPGAGLAPLRVGQDLVLP